MKRSFLVMATVIIAVIICVCAFVPASSTSVAEPVVENSSEMGALEARFTNMLNRNFVYGDTFNSAQAVVDNSTLALLNKRDEDGFINEQIVKTFVKDMYGIEFEIDNSINNLPTKQDSVYVAPRGYTSFSHKILSVKTNEDGSYTVISAVVEKGHDAEESSITATTLFVKNENSSFGFNIISSDLSDEVTTM